MGLSSKRKGQRGEREFCALLSDHLLVLGAGTRIRRNVDQARDGGDDVHIGPFSIEVKRCESLSLPAWIAQAEAQAKARGGGIPVLAYRRSKEPWRVLPILTVEQFAEVLAGTKDKP